MTILLTARPFNPKQSRGKVAQLPWWPVFQHGWLPAEPTFEVQGGLDTVRLADRPYRTGTSDSPSHTPWDARLTSPFNWRLDVFETEPAADRGVAFAVGDVTVNIADGGFDEELEFGWDGREVEILHATATGPSLSSFATIFKGTVSSVVWTESEFSLRLRGKEAVAELPLSRSRYTGTGDAGGDADLTDVEKPLTFGRRRNVSPALVSAAKLVYQVHDGAVQDVDDVRDKGVSLTDSGDTTSDIFSTGLSIGNGNYRTNLGLGLFRLGAAPAGEVTCDVLGDNQGSSSGYVDTTAGIVKRIADEFTPKSLGSLSTSDFDSLDATATGTVGWHVEAGTVVTIAEALDEIMSKAGGWWTFNRSGNLTVDRLADPSTGVVILDKSDLVSIRRIDTAVPSSRRSVGYKEMEVVQSAQDLASTSTGGLTVSDKQLYTRRFRFRDGSNSDVDTRHRLARDVVVESLLDSSGAAQNEATRLLNLHSTERDRYEIRLGPSQRFKRFPGESVRLRFDRFGLDTSTGRDFVVSGVREDAREPTVVLRLWG